VYRENPAIAVMPYEVQSIKVSHFYYGTGLIGGRITQGFFPIDGLQDIELDINACFYDTVKLYEWQPGPTPEDPPIKVWLSDAFTYSDVEESCWFDYNFAYIPENGGQFYDELIPYRTIVSLTLYDGKEETIVYDVTTRVYGFPHRSVLYGNGADIRAELYLKDKLTNGRIKLHPLTDPRVTNVWLTVMHLRTGELAIPRHSIGTGVLLPHKIVGDPVTPNVEYNLQYTFETRQLDRPGDFWIIIEIESESGNIPCRFEIPLTVT
jgi:hypothetical protein